MHNCTVCNPENKILNFLSQAKRPTKLQAKTSEPKSGDKLAATKGPGRTATSGAQIEGAGKVEERREEEEGVGAATSQQKIDMFITRLENPSASVEPTTPAHDD